jgi:hypothetical protein
MAQHPFRVLSERGASSEELAPLFAPDVTFYSPLLSKSVSGKEITLQSLIKAFSLTGLPKYTLELTCNQQTVLLWDGAVKKHEIQGTIVIVEDEAGSIHNLMIHLRPYPVITILWEAMREVAVLPQEFWELALFTKEAI